MDDQLLFGVEIRNVAVATDFSEDSERAIQHGLAVARHFGATLHFLNLVRPSEFPFAPEMMPVLHEAANRDCDHLIARLSGSHQLDGIEFRCSVQEGEIPEVVGHFVRKHRIDLLVVGTRGRAPVPRLLLGSTAQQIFHYVRCPVLTVGPLSPGAGPRLQLKRVLFSTDLSRESLDAIPYVLTTMEEWHPELDLLHVCSASQPDHALMMNDLGNRIEALLEGEEHAPLRSHLLSGKPAACVVDFAGRNKEDLIVLGLKPQRALYDGPVWSQAYEIVRQAECPVLSIRSAQD